MGDRRCNFDWLKRAVGVRDGLNELLGLRLKTGKSDLPLEDISIGSFRTYVFQVRNSDIRTPFGQALRVAQNKLFVQLVSNLKSCMVFFVQLLPVVARITRSFQENMGYHQFCLVILLLRSSKVGIPGKTWDSRKNMVFQQKPGIQAKTWNTSKKMILTRYKVSTGSDPIYIEDQRIAWLLEAMTSFLHYR